MIKYFLLFFLIILTGIFPFEQVQVEDHLMQKIKQNSHYCVHRFEEDKIFINPQNILLSEEGLFLDLNGHEYCALPFLQSNANGCFLSISPMLGCQRKKESKGPCPNCNESTASDGKCWNSECFFYSFKVL